jgi:hypothetical protein
MASAPPTKEKLAVTFGNAANGGAPAAPVLSAMQQELTRSFDGLKKQADPPPYYLAYSVVDRQETSLAASFGASMRAEEARARIADVEVRVGDTKLDNTHGRLAMRRAPPAMLPIEDDDRAFKTRLWLLTDQSYRMAAESLAQARGRREIESAEEDTSDDFSVEKANVFLRAPASVNLDRARWERALREYSASFRKYPDIHASEVRLEVNVVTRYYTTSEGSRLQIPWTHARLMITASTKADDGMDLSRTESLDAETPDALPGEEVVRARMKLVANDLMALRKAPVGDPFVGPAILEGKAAAVFFHEVLGHRVEGHRQRERHEGQTFTKKVGEAIMPPLLKVYDDPTIQTLNGIPVNGHYLFDDEGVAAQRADIVKDGTLVGFLMSRRPIAGFGSSNGHGRRHEGFPLVSRQGNLVVEPSTTSNVVDL